MSEAELHVLQGRLAEGRRKKAQRGELRNHPPIGYVRTASGDYGLDPDEQAQQVVRLIFEQFERQGTLHGLLRFLVHHQIRLPVRPHAGPNRGQLEWRRPNRETLQNLLHHPIYAGAYRWGHRQIDPRKKQPGRRSTGRPPTICNASGIACTRTGGNVGSGRSTKLIAPHGSTRRSNPKTGWWRANGSGVGKKHCRRSNTSSRSTPASHANSRRR
jgi:hypothetical protein